jgi:hypothetical protein
MMQSESQVARLHGASDTRSLRSKKVRFRLAECEHAVRQAARSRRLAKQLIDEAETEQIVTHQEADLMRARIEQA